MVYISPTSCDMKIFYNIILSIRLQQYTQFKVWLLVEATDSNLEHRRENKFGMEGSFLKKEKKDAN